MNRSLLLLGIAIGSAAMTKGIMADDLFQTVIGLIGLVSCFYMYITEGDYDDL